MSKIDSLVQKSQVITRQVKEAEIYKKPIDKLVLQQIKVMEEHHDEFVKEANKLGVDNLERARIEIKLYSMMKAWANKINLSTEKYDNAMNEIRAKFYPINSFMQHHCLINRGCGLLRLALCHQAQTSL